MSGRWQRWLTAALPGSISFLAAVALWEAIVRVFGVSPLILPPPSRIIEEFIKRAPEIAPNAAVTLWEAVVGLAIGVGFAILTSVLITEITLFRRAIYPLILAKQVVPTVVFAPIILVWFGYGVSSKIVMAAVICFFPMIVNTMQGLTSLPREVVELADSLGSSRLKILWRLRLPHAVPYIYTAMRPTVALAMIGAVVGEFIGGNAGLGYMIVQQLRFINLPAMFAATIALVLLGLFLFGVVEVAGMISLGWYRRSLRLPEPL